MCRFLASKRVDKSEHSCIRRGSRHSLRNTTQYSICGACSHARCSMPLRTPIYPALIHPRRSPHRSTPPIPRRSTPADPRADRPSPIPHQSTATPNPQRTPSARLIKSVTLSSLLSAAALARQLPPHPAQTGPQGRRAWCRIKAQARSVAWGVHPSASISLYSFRANRCKHVRRGDGFRGNGHFP